MDRSLDILLIEDNAALSENIADYLEALGHRIDFAYDGRVGLDRALSEHFDVVILDLSLPEIDGLELCRALRHRADRHVAVLMLTARDTLEDKLRGFANGADDYLVKPFALAELAARCAVLAMRHILGADIVLRIGELSIDRRAGEATRAGRPLRLTSLLYRILLALAEAYPAPMTRDELTRRLWGEDPPDSDSLRSHIHILRQVLDKPFATPMLETMHGIGFRLKADA